MISNNHILIGLSIVAISCIYLFYLNFTKSQESNFEKSMIKKINLDNSNLEKKVSKLENVVTYNNKTIRELMDFVNNNNKQDPQQVPHQVPDQVPHQVHQNEYPSENLSEVQMKELAENNIVIDSNTTQEVDNLSEENINNLNTQNTVNNEEDLNNNKEELDEDDINEELISENMEEELDEDDINEELISEEEIESDDKNVEESLNDLTLDDIENINNLDSELVNELETELELDDDDFKLENVDLKKDLNNEDDETKLQDNNEMNLQLSTVKELKLLAKNYGISNRGNKEELIKRITNHLVAKN
jgi:hypothetical protein